MCKLFIILGFALIVLNGCTSASEEPTPNENSLRIERISHRNGEILQYVDSELDLVFMTGDKGPVSRYINLSGATSWHSMRPRAFVEAIHFYRRILTDNYPTEVIHDDLKLIVLAARNSLADTAAQNSIGSRSWASVPNSGIVMTSQPDYRSNPKAAFDLFNHEMAHIITLTEERSCTILTPWRSLLPDGFLYIEEANEQKKTNTVFYDGSLREKVEHGFVSLYAQISYEEDLAETAAVAMGRPLRTQPSQPLQEKIELVQQLYRKVHPEMGPAWFQSARKYRSNL